MLFNTASTELAIPYLLHMSNESLFADCHMKLKWLLYRGENFAFIVTDLYSCLYHPPH